MKQGMASIYLAQAIGNNKSIVVKLVIDSEISFISMTSLKLFLTSSLKNEKHFEVFNIGSGRKTYVQN